MSIAPTSAPATDGIDRLCLAIVIAGAGAAAFLMWRAYAVDPDLLWRAFYHDRNSHYAFGLDLALAAKSFDPAWFFYELERARVWPPAHGLVLSAVLLVFGADHRFAIVPSLIGYALTIVMTFVIARRLFTARLSGLFAAAVAVTLTATSPAFRLISADVMLEALAAGWSATALALYLRAMADPTRAAPWRWLALILTVLFFHKGNYWGLVVAALLLAFLTEHRWRAEAFALWRSIDLRAAWRAARRDPLLILCAALTLAVAVVYARGPATLTLFGHAVSLYPPGNLLTAAYAAGFLSAALAYRRHRAAIDTAIGVPGRMLLAWLVLPVAVSFLLPKRLATFIWFVGPANSAGGYDLMHGLRLYGDAFVNGFHPAPWMALVSVVLFAVAATRIRRFPPGARAIFIFAVLSYAAVVLHPQHQGRFLTPFMFAVWIGAGAGAALLLEALPAGRTAWLRAAIATAVVAGLALAGLRTQPSAAAYAHAIHPTGGPSDLDLVRPYLTDLDGAHEILVATTFGESALFKWMIHEHCQCKVPVKPPRLDGPTVRDQVRQAMLTELATTPADRVVVIDAPNGRYQLALLGWTYDIMVGVVDAMKLQDRFVPVAVYAIPSQNAQATVWRRRP